MADELRFHKEAYIDDLVRRGVTRQEAERRAAVEWGTVEGLKEELRAARGLHLLDELQQDVRYSLRQLRRGRGFAVVAVLSLGVGANLAVFSVVYTALMRPLPHPNPDRLVSISSRELTSGRDHLTAPLDFFDFEQRATSFERLGATIRPALRSPATGRPNGSRVRAPAPVCSTSSASVRCLAVASTGTKTSQVQHPSQSSAMRCGHVATSRRRPSSVRPSR